MLSPRSILVCIWEILHRIQDDGFSSYWRSCWPCEALCYVFERSFTLFKMTVLYIQDDSSWSINSFIDIAMIVYIDRGYTSLITMSSSTIIYITSTHQNITWDVELDHYPVIVSRWWNWYTRTIEVRMPCAWEFESPLRHICVHT